MKIISNKREQVSAGVYLARVAQVDSLGLQPGFEWQGKTVAPKHKVELTYELGNELMQDGRPFWVSEELTNTDNEKGTLVKRVNATGVSFATFDQILGKAVTVTIEQNEKGYAKIVNVAGVPGGYDVPELLNPPKLFDVYADEPDIESFKAYPEFKRNKFIASLDFKEQPLFAMLTSDGYFEDTAESQGEY